MFQNIKLILLIFSIVIFSSCKSVEKYNKQVSKKHTPKELRDDVDFAYKKLKRLHPNLYLYIDKYSLDNKFDSLKKSIITKMSSQDFYKKMSPVIASIRQGHSITYQARLKQTKKDFKQRGKRNNPFQKLRFRKIGDKVILTKNFGKDSTIIDGSELLKIENESVKSLINSYKPLITSDGFNTTLQPELLHRYVGSFYTKTHPSKDSLKITLKNNDRVYHKYVYAYPRIKNLTKKQFDSVKNIPQKKLSKIEKRKAKKERKAKRKRDYKYGFNEITKEDNRNFKFINKENTPSIAYLKINAFTNGDFKDFYEESFKKIDSLNCKNLIIDLRYNGGGRLAEIANLYSYLTDKEHIFITNGKMTRSDSWLYPYFHNKRSVFSKSMSTLAFPVMKIIQLFKVKKKDGNPYFEFPSSDLQQPSEKHNYKGKVYVLINGSSFSASSVISNHLKATKRAYFVGNETGGAYNSTVAGRMASVELPNSKNVILFGLINLETPYKESPAGYGVKPDKYIPVTTHKIDEQLEWIIENIGEKKEP